METATDSFTTPPVLPRRTVLPLTVRTDYLPTWKTRHGLRELVQNYLDSCDDTGVAGRLEAADPWDSDDTIILHNPGASIDRSALLFGGTSKTGSDTARGRFGEGLKLGALALVREGAVVTLDHDRERWTFGVVTSEEYGGSVLAVTVTDLDDDVDGVLVTVTGKTAIRTWSGVRALFREFVDVGAVYATDDGDLLLDENQRGNVWVRGQLIRTDDRLSFGYDLKSAWTDRDRDVVGTFDVAWSAGKMVNKANEAGVVAGVELLRLLNEGGGDSTYVTSTWSEKTNTEAAKAFIAVHGQDAVPVTDALSEDDRTALVGFGYFPVVVSDNAAAVLTKTLPGAHAAIQAASSAVLDTPTDYDADALRWIGCILTACGLATDVVAVTFRSPKTGAVRRDGVVNIAASLLSDRPAALAAACIACHENGDARERWAKVLRAVIEVS